MLILIYAWWDHCHSWGINVLTGTHPLKLERIAALEGYHGRSKFKDTRWIASWIATAELADSITRSARKPGQLPTPDSDATNFFQTLKLQASSFKLYLLGNIVQACFSTYLKSHPPWPASLILIGIWHRQLNIPPGGKYMYSWPSSRLYLKVIHWILIVAFTFWIYVQQYDAEQYKSTAISVFVESNLICENGVFTNQIGLAIQGTCSYTYILLVQNFLGNR